MPGPQSQADRRTSRPNGSAIAHVDTPAVTPGARVDNGSMSNPIPSDGDAAIAHDLATLAGAAATAVAPYLRSVARTVTSFETKVDVHDPVTLHDRRVEGALHALLARMVPGSRVLGEETGEHVLPLEPPKLTGEFTEHFLVPTSPEVQGALRRCAPLRNRVRWIIDPIDGTANFAAGMSYFNTSVAAEVDGTVVAGAVSVPMSHELFVGDRDRCWVEGPRPAHHLPSRLGRAEAGPAARPRPRDTSGGGLPGPASPGCGRAGPGDGRGGLVRGDDWDLLQTLGRRSRDPPGARGRGPCPQPAVGERSAGRAAPRCRRLGTPARRMHRHGAPAGARGDLSELLSPPRATGRGAPTPPGRDLHPTGDPA